MNAITIAGFVRCHKTKKTKKKNKKVSHVICGRAKERTRRGEGMCVATVCAFGAVRSVSAYTLCTSLCEADRVANRATPSIS